MNISEMDLDLTISQNLLDKKNQHIVTVVALYKSFGVTFHKKYLKRFWSHKIFFFSILKGHNPKNIQHTSYSFLCIISWFINKFSLNGFMRYRFYTHTKITLTLGKLKNIS